MNLAIIVIHDMSGQALSIDDILNKDYVRMTKCVQIIESGYLLGYLLRGLG